MGVLIPFVTAFFHSFYFLLKANKNKFLIEINKITRARRKRDTVIEFVGRKKRVEIVVENIVVTSSSGYQYNYYFLFILHKMIVVSFYSD